MAEKYESLEALRSKIDWEGGLESFLMYGFKAEELPGGSRRHRSGSDEGHAGEVGGVHSVRRTLCREHRSGGVLMDGIDGPAHLEPRLFDEDKPVPVSVSMVVWVKRHGWEAEYSIDPNDIGEDSYEFEEAFKEQFIADCQEFFVEQGEMQNVTEITE